MSNAQIVFSVAAQKDAWLKVKSKGRSGGIDNVTVSDFESDLEKNLELLFSEIVSGRYVPEPYRLFFIEKTGKEIKEYRPLALMTVRDKIAQNCVSLHFAPQFEKKFTDTSYAYRANKGHPKAIARVNDFVLKKYGFAANLDIDNFFDSIDRKILFSLCREWFKDEVIQKLLEMWVLTGFVHHGKYIRSEKGIAQGGVLSPMLSNIYLHNFDMMLKELNIPNVRYADNIIVFGKNEEDTLKSRNLVVKFLDENLKLKLNTVERDVIPVSEGFAFCGIQFKDGKKTISQGKYNSIIKKHTLTIQQSNLKDALYKLRESIEGLNRYYTAYDTEEQLSAIRTNFLNTIAKKITDLIKKNQLKNENDAIQLFKKYPEITKGDTGNRIFINSLKIALEFIKIESNSSIPSSSHTTSTPSTLPKPKLKPDSSAPPKPDTSKDLAPSPNNTDKEAERLVERKRKVYYNRFVESLDMMISGNYAHIGKSGGKITVKKEGKVIKEVFANKLSSLIINAHGTTISADAVRLCIENKVLVNYFDDLGKPYAIIFAIASGANSVSTAQAFASKGERGKNLVKQLVWAKITNQAALVKFVTKNKKLDPDQKLIVDKSLEEMQDLALKVKSVKISEAVDGFRSRIFGYEGSAAVSYWNVIKLVIPDHYEFKMREHQNAQNMINQMFNYGYGILYSKILAAAVLAGLNPNIPFLHSETKGKPTLTFDLIEPFRPVIVDRTILSIISRSGKLISSGNKLSDDVRHLVSTKVMQRLYSELDFRGGKVTLNDIIIQNSKEIAAFLSGNSESFKPYTMKW
ncbi:hypothetical protein MASR2M39_29030 [Ignavibacteriales bacterium]